MKYIKIGIIGGSGLYHIESLKDVKKVKVKTPFGNPSDDIVTGKLNGVSVAFLPRHGKGHRFLPSEIPQKANIYALKSLGVDTILTFNAVGSLKEEFAPGHFVFPDQLVDATKGRDYTFFGNGIVGHVSFAHPFCAQIQEILYRKAVSLGIKSHKGGTLVCIEGPQFSTKAESEHNIKMGYSIVGMTTSPEAKLAREAGICYAPVSLVTDYDAWKEGEEVTSEMVIATVNKNIAQSKKLLVESIEAVASAKPICNCAQIIKTSLATEKTYIPQRQYKKLELFFK
ncbi:MAG: S-methyl-5'-thioadenosine phosphorylase [Elusimicrobia bacterium]|nr:S-methyl-5'-thioadenosine phosphorylase [Elusimicrobiota bacterium]